MVLTNNNILVTKFASKWVLNLLNENTVIDEDFIQCMLYLIGDHKNLLTQIVNHAILSPLNDTYGNDFEDDLDELLSKSHGRSQEGLLKLLDKYPLCKDVIIYECEQALRENTKIYTGPFKSYELYSRIYIDYELSDVDRELWLLFYTLKNHPEIKRFIFMNSKIEVYQIYIGNLLDIDRDTLMKSLCKFLTFELFDYKNGKLSVSELFKDI